jgi:nucleoid DNA-binding protein
MKTTEYPYKNYKDLAKKIRARLRDAISQDLAEDVICEIIDYMIACVRNDQAFTVEHFGTLSPYIYPGRVNCDLQGNKRKCRDTKLVRFHPHVVFADLIRVRKRRFLIGMKTRQRKKLETNKKV